jgi:hypothetical protein
VQEVLAVPEQRIADAGRRIAPQFVEDRPRQYDNRGRFFFVGANLNF